MTPISVNEKVDRASPRRSIIRILKKDMAMLWSVKELAEKLGYSKTAIKSALDVMMKEGLVDRGQHRDHAKTYFYGFAKEMNEE